MTRRSRCLRNDSIGNEIATLRSQWQFG